jgi:uncharacterized protein YbjQ (UPF0145 family)
MKKIFGLLAVALIPFVMASCAVTQSAGGMVKGTVQNAMIVKKDYDPLGIVFASSEEKIDARGNRTGSKVTYEMIMREAQKLGADDIINYRVDVNRTVEYKLGAKANTTYEYTASALAIKYTETVTEKVVAKGKIKQDYESLAEDGLSGGSSQSPTWWQRNKYYVYGGAALYFLILLVAVPK